MNNFIEKEFLRFCDEKKYNKGDKIEYFGIDKLKLFKLIIRLICACIVAFIVFYTIFIKRYEFAVIILIPISIFILLKLQHSLTYLHEFIHSLSVRRKRISFNIIIDDKNGVAGLKVNDWTIFNKYEVIFFFISPLMFNIIITSLTICLVDILFIKMIAFNILLLEIYGSAGDIYFTYELIKKVKKIKYVVIPDSKYNYLGLILELI